MRCCAVRAVLGADHSPLCARLMRALSSCVLVVCGCPRSLFLAPCGPSAVRAPPPPAWQPGPVSSSRPQRRTRRRIVQAEEGRTPNNTHRAGHGSGQGRHHQVRTTESRERRLLSVCTSSLTVERDPMMQQCGRLLLRLPRALVTATRRTLTERHARHPNTEHRSNSDMKEGGRLTPEGGQGES